MIYKRGKCKTDPEGRCAKCGKRGSCGVYWYKFMWQGQLIRESTKQGNDKIARQMEAAHRTSLARGEVGLRDKLASPTLADFCSSRIEPWAKSRFETACYKNWTWFRTGIRALTAYKRLARTPLDKITGELASEFAAHRLKVGMQVSASYSVF